MKKQYKVIVQFRDKNEDRIVKVGEILELEPARASEILNVGGFIRPATDEDLKKAEKLVKTVTSDDKSAEKIESNDEVAEDSTEKESDNVEDSAKKPKKTKKSTKKGKK